MNNGSDDVLVRVTHGSSQSEEYWILAKGTRTSHTVKFYLKDPGESTYTQVDSAEIDDGGTATPPSEPTSKEDTSGRTYSFDGWYEDEACQTPAVFTNITADKNYYAEYNIDQHAVTFNLKDAGETSFVKVGDDTVDDGGSAAAPPEPANKKVDGSTYEFDGWYEDEACQTPAVLTNIKDDKDYYAKYDLVGHDVTFMLKDAGQSSFATVTTDMVEDGADAEAPDEGQEKN